MYKHRKAIATLTAAVLLITLVPAQPAGAVSLSKLKQKFYSTAKSIRSIQSRLRPLKHKAIVAEQNLQHAKHKYYVTQRNLRDVQSQLQTTKQKLDATLDVLHVIERRLEERNNLLGSRLIDTYKYGNINYLGVFLGASDIWDVLNATHIVRKIVQRDADLVEGIRKDKEAVEAHKQSLERQKQRRVELERRQRALTIQAHGQAAECNRIVKTIAQQRAELESQLAEEMAASRQVSATINSIMRRMRSTPQGRRRLATPWHGSFAMPVQGRITSPFGMRYHPILHSRRMHTGTDIAAPSGTPVHAAASGVVVLSGWNGRVYGNTVMLDHGGGMFTFYGHCSRVAVRVGQTVRRGQTVSYVGSTGLSTGPHVHFEVQKNGRPVSPFGSF